MNTVVYSFLIPCLNEEASIKHCIEDCHDVAKHLGKPYEIIVADNGSVDNSVEIAKRNNARVVHIVSKGYGNALRGGIKAANGNFIVMADADHSYDFREAQGLFNLLEEGQDMVIGCRFASGGGTIEHGAMPFINRYLGNPVLSGIAKILFKSPIRDFHCGIRAVKRETILNLKLEAEGMEFATEMIARATLAKCNISEHPVTLRKSKRNRSPHLRPFRDGLRHLICMLNIILKYKNVRIDNNNLYAGKRAFSLIELMVVVSIITILSALFVSASRSVIQKATSIKCQSNLRNLQIAMVNYASDNSGAIPNNHGFPHVSTWRGAPYSWAGASSVVMDTNLHNIKSGSLYGYIGNPLVLKCPDDDSVVNTSGYDSTRSYSLNHTFGGIPGSKNKEANTNIVNKLYDVKYPSKLFSFLGENSDSIDDGNFETYLYPDRRWVNMPAARHGRKGLFVYADGHSTIVGWKYGKKFVRYFQEARNKNDIEDLRLVQESSVNNQ